MTLAGPESIGILGTAFAVTESIRIFGTAFTLPGSISRLLGGCSESIFAIHSNRIGWLSITFLLGEMRAIMAFITHSAFRALRRKIIMAPSAKAKTPATASKTKRPVTLKHLAAVLAEEHQLTKKAGEALLGDLVGLITKHLKKGERIRIAGLGILQVRKRAARMGRNPATGEAIQIKASKKVAFRAAKDLKMAV
jgi:DNA-binding protein HU-beta